MATLEDFQGLKPAWCPGCGDFGILNALKKALVALGKRPEQVLLVSGIGQAAKLPHYLRVNAFNGLHGRALPAALGAKLANHALTVIACGGDGDMYGEGGNHLLHAIRRNPDLTLLVHDNKVYGLTKGQASPTSDEGMRTKVQPLGVFNQPLNPLALAISQHCAFVARSFSGRVEHLNRIIQEGIKTPGLSLIEILQPCVSFNKINTFTWYKDRVYDVQEENHDPWDLHAAMDLAMKWGEKIPIGVLFMAKRTPFEQKWPQLKQKPLVDQDLSSKTASELVEKYFTA